MNVDNYIESQHRELTDNNLLDPEFLNLYVGIENNRLTEIFASLHKQYVSLFKTMNGRLPTADHTAYFWADPSRQLLSAIEMTMGLYRSLKNSNYAFEIDFYYHELLKSCLLFLSKSGGSTLPENMEKVNLYYTVPIFISAMSQKLTRNNGEKYYDLKLIDQGSYAQIFKYRDEDYAKDFAIKRAKKDLSPKELERFKREFEEMRNLRSPYILEVYAFDEVKLQYTMEYMDFSLEKYIHKSNNKLTLEQRKMIALQILRAFNYLHSKELVHRDISPKNILLKEYDDVMVVKISDFGLVKTPDSSLTSKNTEFKGYFNDPTLVTDGFESYGILHEIYSLTNILFYVMTGKTNASSIADANLEAFVKKGLNADKNKRYQNIEELTDAFKNYLGSKSA